MAILLKSKKSMIQTIRCDDVNIILTSKSWPLMLSNDLET